MSRYRTRRDLLLFGATLVGAAPLATLGVQNVGGVERGARRSRIIAACTKHWPGQTHDCSGFVRAVAADLGVTLTGQANQIYDQIHQRPWTAIGTGNNTTAVAGLSAAEGNFVVGASRGADNGHVAIIVDYQNAFASYPADERNTAIGFWGSMRSVGGRDYTKITESWGTATMEGTYFAYLDI